MSGLHPTLTEDAGADRCGGSAELSWGGHRLRISTEPSRIPAASVVSAESRDARVLGEFLCQAWNEEPLRLADAVLEGKAASWRDGEVLLEPAQRQRWRVRIEAEHLEVEAQPLRELVALFMKSALTWVRFCPAGHTSETDALEHRLLRLQSN